METSSCLTMISLFQRQAE